MDFDKFSPDDLKSMLKCIEFGLLSNFHWCLDCEREDCPIKTSGSLNRNY